MRIAGKDTFEDRDGQGFFTVPRAGTSYFCDVCPDVCVMHVQVRMPGILQEYIEHSSVLYKVYVAGAEVRSLPWQSAIC